MKSGNLHFLERCGSIQACNGTALPLLVNVVHGNNHSWRIIRNLPTLSRQTGDSFIANRPVAGWPSPLPLLQKPVSITQLQLCRTCFRHRGTLTESRQLRGLLHKSPKVTDPLGTSNRKIWCENIYRTNTETVHTVITWRQTFIKINYILNSHHHDHPSRVRT